MQNQNEDFAVNPLRYTGGSFMVLGVHFARKGVQKRARSSLAGESPPSGSLATPINLALEA